MRRIRKICARTRGIAIIRAEYAGCVFLHDRFVVLEHLALAIGRDDTAEERECEHHDEDHEARNRQFIAHKALEHQHARGKYADAAFVVQLLCAKGFLVVCFHAAPPFSLPGRAGLPPRTQCPR